MSLPKEVIVDIIRQGKSETVCLLSSGATLKVENSLNPHVGLEVDVPNYIEGRIRIRPLSDTDTLDLIVSDLYSFIA